ncbi:zinc finger BED domain-containing 4-like [Solea senegalensis]|uniref:Zinc finger BED domain-containing 4-like n=1 Tax=Solea senegalensis TaxID=28829 RepID=A0AAV6S4Q5_SOLSE|nr:zinc finger BED domain-containing 4-like [Solea senegalensis]
MARTQDGITAPFSDPVYLKAAALDPAFSLLWVEPHVLVNHDVKVEVAQPVKVAIRVLAVPASSAPVEQVSAMVASFYAPIVHK